MSVFFSRQCEYALQAVMYIALKPDHEMTSIRELATSLNIPYHFLAKILQDLTHKGLLSSLKGSSGGYMLATPKQSLTAYQIVEAIDGSEFLTKCIIGFPTCSSETPCSIHEDWAKFREQLHAILKRTSVVEMALAMKKPAYHHTPEEKS
ncbi:MAG TPA: Rrf2 family transcriptional regulator [Bacteroidota bacterium]|nr:Rrf2 family transcriptional regulator [Bacteroidota bacterium]